MGDAYIAAAQQYTNFDTSSLVIAGPGAPGGQRYAFVKFDYSTLPAYGQGDLVKATLTVYVNSMTAGGTFNVTPAGNNWDETTLTWQGQPVVQFIVPGSTASGPWTGTVVRKNTFVSVDITPIVQYWAYYNLPYPDDQQTLSLALYQQSGTADFTLESKEGSGHEPRLDITVEPIAAINAEKTRAEAVEAQLAAQVGAETVRATAAETTLTTNLDDEVTRAQAAEASISSALTAEVTRAEGAESSLESQLVNVYENLNAKIAKLSTAVATEVTRAEGVESTLQSALSSIQATLSPVSLVGSTFLFKGVNVQIVDGSGATATLATDGSGNGLGNLIIGYDEKRGDSTDARTGSHNLVLGSQNSFSSWGAIVSGQGNTSSNASASCIGGTGGIAGGNGAVIIAGADDYALGDYSAAVGGFGSAGNNAAKGEGSVVVGGSGDAALGQGAVVCGGSGDTATGNYSAAYGGQNLSDAVDYTIVLGPLAPAPVLN